MAADNPVWEMWRNTIAETLSDPAKYTANADEMAAIVIDDLWPMAEWLVKMLVEKAEEVDRLKIELELYQGFDL